jgi:hypothetical protein
MMEAVRISEKRNVSKDVMALMTKDVRISGTW